MSGFTDLGTHTCTYEQFNLWLKTIANGSEPIVPNCDACREQNEALRIKRMEARKLIEMADHEEACREREATAEILRQLKTAKGRAIKVNYEPRADHEGGYGHREEAFAMKAQVWRAERHAQRKWWEFWK